MNQELRVFVANGYYDLVTPFFDAEYTLTRHGIPADRIDGVIATALDSERPPNQRDSEATLKKQAGHEACGQRPAPVTCQG